MQCKSNLLYHFGGEIHHPVVILVSHVDLQCCKFRIVRTVHTFVTEVTRELVNPFISPHYQSFQVKLIGNTQIQRNVQSIVMCNERASRSTSRYRLQHRSVNFKVAVAVKKVTYGLNEQSTFSERFTDFGIYHKINIPLTITHFRI